MNTKSTVSNMHGFTLVELMIVVALSGIAVIAIYRGYTAFSQSADAQEQIIEMQQNLRIGMYWLEKDLRRAGMTEEDNNVIFVDLNGNGTIELGERANVEEATFLTAGASTVEFGMDLGSGGVFANDGVDNDGDGLADDGVATNNNETDDPEALEEGRVGDNDFDDDGERIQYSLDNDEDTNDNGVLDPGEDLNDNNVLDQWLVRKAWDNATGAYIAQTIITNVDALNFVYLDEDGAVIGDPLTAPLTAAQRLLIRSVQVSMVVRTTNEDYRYTNRETYQNINPDGPDSILPKTGDPTLNDNFRRRVTSKQIKIRNAGL